VAVDWRWLAGRIFNAYFQGEFGELGSIDQLCTQSKFTRGSEGEGGLCARGQFVMSYYDG